MADRTWNPCDARLYDEPWSAGAIMVANCLLTRCPNQYGVFDFPLGFILRFYHGIFCKMEIEAFMQEWEAAGFAKFYKDRKVIWIRSKWKRAGRPNENHWKGLNTHLEAYPEVRKDFLSLYEPYWKGVESPSNGDTHPHRNTESESESDPEPESEETDKIQTPDKSGGRVKVGPLENILKTERNLFPEIYAFVDELFPGKWTGKELKAQADALRLICRQDTDGPDETIFDCLRWAKADEGNGDWPGWSKQFLSFSALRRKRDGVTKFEKVWTSYQATLKTKRSRSDQLDDETKFTGVTGRKEL